jgi:hypothetical protein
VYFRTLDVYSVSENGLPRLIRDHRREVKHRERDRIYPTRPTRQAAPDMPTPDLTESDAGLDASQ